MAKEVGKVDCCRNQDSWAHMCNLTCNPDCQDERTQKCHDQCPPLCLEADYMHLEEVCDCDVCYDKIKCLLDHSYNKVGYSSEYCNFVYGGFQFFHLVLQLYAARHSRET